MDEDLLTKLMRLATGHTADDLHNMGGAYYPQENNAENQGGHRLAANLMTQRFGPVVSQVAGLANEGLEAANNKAVSGQWFPHGTAEPMRDLGANWRGMTDAVGDQVSTMSPIVKAMMERFVNGRVTTESPTDIAKKARL